MYKNLVLSVLGLGIVAGLGFLAIESNNKIIKQGDTDTGKPVENPINGFSEFGKVITFKLNDKTVFSDGLNVELKGINDSRCPKDVQCIWAGELAGTFMASGGKLSKSSEIRLGTENNKSVTFEGYTFRLQNATESSMTILVEFPGRSEGPCYVGGCGGQICSDKKDLVTTCEYPPGGYKYNCGNSTCERQQDGQCGWSSYPSCILNQ